MTEATAQIGGAAHLPEQPRHALCPGAGFGRKKFAKFFGEINKNSARFEDPRGRFCRVVEQGGNLGIGVDIDKAAANLIALTNVGYPGVLFGAAVSQRQQLLEQDGDYHTVWRTQRIELKSMLAHR